MSDGEIVITCREGSDHLLRYRLGAQPDALIGHLLGGGVVHQMSMLDTLHPGADGLLDGFRRVRMYGYVGAPVPRRFHRGAHFGFGERDDIERVVPCRIGAFA